MHTQHKHRCALILLLLSCLLKSAHNALLSDESRLMLDLFNNHNEDVKPGNTSVPITVSLETEIIRIIEVKAKYQYIKTYCWINQYWKNELLKWQPEKYGGVKLIQVQPNRVWVPDILLYNNVNEHDVLGGGRPSYKAQIVIKHDGNVTWMNPVVLQSVCNIDVTTFPFDEQECVMKFGSWSYDITGIDIIPKTVAVNSEYVSNGEWELRDLKVVRNAKKYQCCEHEYVDVTVILKLRRESLQYVIRLIIPCACISCMILMSFLLPAECGERISLSINILLAMVVFQQLSSEIMPPYGFPLLSQYYFASMLEIGCSLCLNTVILNLSCRKNQSVPLWLRYIVVNLLKTCLYKKEKSAKDKLYLMSSTTNAPRGGTNSPDRTHVRMIAAHAQQYLGSGDFVEQAACSSSSEVHSSDQVQNRSSDRMDEDADHSEEWTQVACALDRLFLFLFVIIVFGTLLGVLLRSPRFFGSN